MHPWRKIQAKSRNSFGPVSDCDRFGLRAAGRRVQRHVGKDLVGVLAEGGDGQNADDDNQRQHNCVFDSRGAVFILQKPDRALGEVR